MTMSSRISSGLHCVSFTPSTHSVTRIRREQRSLYTAGTYTSAEEGKR